MSSASNPSLAVSAFTLDVRSITPENGRASMLARIEFRSPNREFLILVNGRGVCLFPPGESIDPPLKDAIRAEVKRLLVIALREQIVRGANSQKMLWRIDPHGLEGRRHVRP
ncbi:hypothetical protein [Teichococcus vastitatis]|uniref:hypothetical protein n=1 Tax=Teichococcus vastitatis TaxID=2307076 RepID=UPI000E739D25|nr:hypothetical protein [Pseudoroseomonas vastitatis]